MKIAALIARILLGVIFLVFGPNAFLHFMNSSLPSGVAGQFLGALLQSHYDLVVSAAQIAGGTLLLVNRYVPLALGDSERSSSAVSQKKAPLTAA